MPREHTKTTETNEDVWERLQRPFPFADTEFIDRHSGFNSKHQVARLRIKAMAIALRLDEVVGPEGWRFEFDYLGENLMRCRLTIHGAVRDGIARAADYQTACHESFLAAAAHFQIAVALQGHVKVFLEKDASGITRNLAQIERKLQDKNVVAKD